MGKNEQNEKIQQIKKLANSKKYKEAADIADTIEWKKTKVNSVLLMVSQIYEMIKEYNKSKELLLIAYDRAQVGRQMAYRLCSVCLKNNELEEAKEFYNDYCDLAPGDNRKYLLDYKILKASGKSIDKQIEVLKNFTDVEMDEKWLYEIAKLYYKAGDKENCINICNKLSLWFNEGRYVEKALLLKKSYLLTEQKEETDKDKDTEALNEKENEPPRENAFEDTQKLDEAIAMAKALSECEKSESKENVVEKEAEAKACDPVEIKEDTGFNMEDIKDKKEDVKDENSHIEFETKSTEYDLKDDFSAFEKEQQKKDNITNERLAVWNINTGQEKSVDEQGIAEKSVDKKSDTQEDAAKETADEKEVDNENEADNEKEADDEKENVSDIDEVLSLVDELESKDTKTEVKTSDFDIPDTPKEEKYYLDEKYKDVFEQFLTVTGLENDLAKTIYNLREKYDHDGTSKKNNIIVIGEAKSGKTTLAAEIIKLANNERGRKGRKIAKINGNNLNKKGIAASMPRLLGSDLIIENAGIINDTMIRQIMNVFCGYTDEMIIVLEDDKSNMERLLDTHPSLKEIFNNIITIKEYDINEWVAYAKAYANENGYTVDDIGTLALYARIDSEYGIKRGLEKEDVNEIMDKAMANANKKGLSKFFGKMFKSETSNKLIMIKETDFD